jgi:hypothetical protein
MPRIDPKEATLALATALDESANPQRGKTIVQRIQDLLDAAVDQEGVHDEYVRGVADALAILRSSSREQEIAASIERRDAKIPF